MDIEIYQVMKYNIFFIDSDRLGLFSFSLIAETT